jgi:hypothetical protein
MLTLLKQLPETMLPAHDTPDNNVLTAREVLRLDVNSGTGLHEVRSMEIDAALL